MKTGTRTLLCLTVLTLACGTLFAADQRVPDRVITLASGDIKPNVVNDAKLKTIFSNLGSKTDTYDSTNGWLVAGPNSSRGLQWIAMPFTPRADATVTQIQSAVAYGNQGGINGFNLVLAADSSGLPGKPLHSWDLKNLRLEDTCCKLDIANYAKGVKVKKGTQYWVVSQTDSKSTTAVDGWSNTWNDSTGNFAFNKGSGWSLYNGTLSAFAVKGK